MCGFIICLIVLHGLFNFIVFYIFVFVFLTFNCYYSIQSENRYDHSERRVTKLERDIERLEGRKQTL